MHVRHVSGRGARTAEAVRTVTEQQTRAAQHPGSDASGSARHNAPVLSTSPTPTRGWSAPSGDTGGWAADWSATGSAVEAEFSLPREVFQTLALLVTSVALTAVLATLAHVAVGLFG
jgi:hypothetical protein